MYAADLGSDDRPKENGDYNFDVDDLAPPEEVN